jgi:hypothetical protein
MTRGHADIANSVGKFEWMMIRQRTRYHNVYRKIGAVMIKGGRLTPAVVFVRLRRLRADASETLAPVSRV